MSKQKRKPLKPRINHELNLLTVESYFGLRYTSQAVTPSTKD